MIIKMILTNSYDPDPRVYKEAKTLVDAGFDIEILAWDRENNNCNKIIDNDDGIVIRRFYSSGEYGSGIKQLFGFLNFMKMVNVYLKGTNYDVLHCHDFDGLVIGYFIKLFRTKTKLVYDEHDLFYLYFEGRKGLINKLISNIIKIIEGFMLKKVNHHIVVTPNMREMYSTKTNPIVITNAPLEKSFNKTDKLKRKNIVIGFIGAVRYIEELKMLLDVADKFTFLRILIAGRGTKLNELQEYISHNNYTNVELFGQYNIKQLEELYSKIDITYLVYPVKDSLISLPNKFFESIVTKTPMIAYSNSEFGSIIKNKRFGWCVDSGSLELDLINIFNSLQNDKRVITKIKDNMTNENYNYLWENNIEKLLKIYE